LGNQNLVSTTGNGDDGDSTSHGDDPASKRKNSQHFPRGLKAFLREIPVGRRNVSATLTPGASGYISRMRQSFAGLADRTQLDPEY
jgi:hypothetical protein